MQAGSNSFDYVSTGTQTRGGSQQTPPLSQKVIPVQISQSQNMCFTQNWPTQHKMQPHPCHKTCGSEFEPFEGMSIFESEVCNGSPRDARQGEEPALVESSPAAAGCRKASRGGAVQSVGPPDSSSRMHCSSRARRAATNVGAILKDNDRDVSHGGGAVRTHLPNTTRDTANLRPRGQKSRACTATPSEA